MRFILVSILAINFSLVAPCFGQRDVDSLKAANRILAESVTLANVDLFIQRIHPQALGFFKASQFPVQFTPQNDVRDMAPTLLAELSTFISMTLQDAYRVIGDTGVVCSTFSRTPATGQDKKKRTEYNRATYVYTKVGNTWQLVTWHTSSIPLN